LRALSNCAWLFSRARVEPNFVNRGTVPCSKLLPSCFGATD
jgi:hypothetical protein